MSLTYFGNQLSEIFHVVESAGRCAIVFLHSAKHLDELRCPIIRKLQKRIYEKIVKET